MKKASFKEKMSRSSSNDDIDDIDDIQDNYILEEYQSKLNEYYVDNLIDLQIWRACNNDDKYLKFTTDHDRCISDSISSRESLIKFSNELMNKLNNNDDDWWKKQNGYHTIELCKKRIEDEEAQIEQYKKQIEKYKNEYSIWNFHDLKEILFQKSECDPSRFPMHAIAAYMTQYGSEFSKYRDCEILDKISNDLHVGVYELFKSNPQKFEQLFRISKDKSNKMRQKIIGNYLSLFVDLSKPYIKKGTSTQLTATGDDGYDIVLPIHQHENASECYDNCFRNIFPITGNFRKPILKMCSVLLNKSIIVFNKSSMRRYTPDFKIFEYTEPVEFLNDLQKDSSPIILEYANEIEFTGLYFK